MHTEARTGDLSAKATDNAYILIIVSSRAKVREPKGKLQLAPMFYCINQSNTAD